MPTHLFCFLPTPISMSGTSVRTIDAGGISAWVSDTSEERLSRDAREATRATIDHDRVIGSALARGVTPVPATLADPYPGDAEAVEDIARFARDIDLALARVAGNVEMTTILALNDSPSPGAAEGRGRAYLESLRSQPARLAALGDRIASALGPLAGEPQRRPGSGTLALSHLIPRTEVEAYRGFALTLAGEGYRIVIDGPRAPYSFVRFSPRRGILTEGTPSAA